ncbi:GNAT family N-acetyltransferase [Chloroflexota bacterium]
MIELKPNDYGRVRPLFAEMAAVHVSIGSVLDGYSPGFVYVDDGDTPSLAFLSSPEGAHLIGTPTNPDWREDVAAFVQDTLLDERGWSDVYVIIGDNLDGLKHCFPMFDAFQIMLRYYYTCTELAFDWRANLPAGYEVRRLDADLLTDPAITHGNGRSGWKHICEWMIMGWSSMACFLEHGFGFVTLHDNAVVSYSLADGRSGDECEIGIHTVPDYRQHGLAALTTAAAVEYALANNYRLVGWHCDQQNDGSWHTAERVGFVRAQNYGMNRVCNR